MSRALDTHSDFIPRHIGPSEADQAKMLAVIGCTSLDASSRKSFRPASATRRRWRCPARAANRTCWPN